jgi:hypothetical protein
MHVSHRSALTFAAISIIPGLAVVGTPPAEAASYHCQHKVQDAVWSWTFNRDSYATGGDGSVRHAVKPQSEYVTVQLCDNRVAADRFRIKSETQCLTDPNHSSRHTGATFNTFFHLQESSTRVNPAAHKVEEDGSPEHRCERHGVPREDQRWMRWVDRPVASVVTTQNLRFWPDASTDWRTSSGSRDRRMYRSDTARVGFPYWPGY